MKKPNDGVILISVRLDKEVLQNFRMAISRKHKGVMRGTTFTEFNNALIHWTDSMNSEIEKRRGIRAPLFTPEER
jgi:hypothetical protein